MIPQEPIAGIDVAKDWLDVAVNGQVQRVDNAPPALRRLAARLRKAGVGTVGMEPTGGYERTALAILRGAGLTVLQVDSWRLRQFAKSRGTRTKTDPIDARLIADFLAREPARPFPEWGETQTRLTAWVREVGRAEADIRRLQNRRTGCQEPAIRTRLDAEIAALKDTVRAGEQAIAALLAEQSELAAKADRLETIPGVGTKTVRVLLAELPELGTLTSRSAAALAGLAPYHRHSGKRKPPGHIEGGRAAITRAAYLAALAATRHNPWADELYRQLRAKGKAAKIALIAIARRLIVIANAMLRTKTDWNQDALKHHPADAT